MERNLLQKNKLSKSEKELLGQKKLFLKIITSLVMKDDDFFKAARAALSSASMLDAMDGELDKLVRKSIEKKLARKNAVK